MRVVVTGIGLTAPLGTDREAVWTGLLSGNTPVAPVPEAWHLYAKLHSPLYAPLPVVDYASRGITRMETLQLDKTALLALYAAYEACAHAGLTATLRDEKRNSWVLNEFAEKRGTVVLGTGVGGITSFSENQGHHLYAPLKSEGPLFRYPPKFHPYAVTRVMPNSAGAMLGLRYSIHGPNETVCTACAAGTGAIGRAFRAIESGQVDYAITGGVECLADEYGGIFRAFDIAGTLARGDGSLESLNRPFDKKRSGFLFGAGGAAVLVLESLELAILRGAQPIAEIVGFAETFDGYSLMAVEPSGQNIEKMFNVALADATLQSRDIDYLNAHGTGTVLNDEVESAVIGRLFGKRVAINATKSMTGHLIGASGALEAAVTALSLNRQQLHGCANLEEPIADLNFIKTSKSHSMQYAMTHSFAFGGHNSALVFKTMDGVGQ